MWALGLPIGPPIVALSLLFLMPRIYFPADLDELLAGFPDMDGCRWEKGPAKNLRGPKSGAYLLGTPTRDRRSLAR